MSQGAPLIIQIWAKKSREQTSTKVSVESDLCVPCNLRLFTQFPRGLQSPFWSSVPVNRSSLNSHRRSVPDRLLSGKSSLPNFCIFLFFRLSLVHYLFRNRSRIVLWSHRNPARLDLESSQELWESGSSPFAIARFTSGNSRVVSEAVEASSRAQWSTRVLCHGLGSVRRHCSCGQPHRVLQGISHDGKFATGASPLFAVEFLTQVLEAASKALWDGAVIPEKGFHEVQSKDQDILNHAASPWISNIANSPDRQMDLFVEFLASSFPALAGITSLSSSSANPSVEGTSPMLPILDGIAGGLGTEGERSSRLLAVLFRWLVVVRVVVVARCCLESGGRHSCSNGNSLWETGSRRL